ncbi:MAG: cell division protein ZapA [Bacteroidales bacterium]|nr:cell division protein ZapA [Bacteroidales bacterium]
MEQKISIKIAGRIFNLTAASPELEELYRQAADAINNRFAAFTRSHPGRTVNDLMSLVALNETVLRLSMQKELDHRKEAEKQLEEDLERYLKDNQ